MVDIFIIILYLLINIIVVYSKRIKKNSFSNYAIGSNLVTTTMLSTSLIATWITSSDVFVAVSKVYLYGIVWVLLFMGNIVSNLLIAKFISPHMYKFNGMLSVAEVMGSLYGKRARIMTAISGIFVSIGFTAAQIFVLYYVLKFIFPINIALSLLLIILLVVFVSSYDGIKTVITTNTIQFAIFIVAIPCIGHVGLSLVGGYENLITELPAKYLDPFNGQLSFFQFTMLLALFFIPFLDPALMQRLLMAKDTEQAVKCMKMVALLSAPFFVLSGLIGLIAVILLPAENPDMLLPIFIQQILPIGLKGFAMIGILAVSMSTMSSYLNTASVLIISDIINIVRDNPMKDKTSLFLGRVFIVVFILISASFAFYGGNIFNIIIQVLNFWGPIIVAPLLYGIIGRRGREKDFFISALVGLIVFVLWGLFKLENVLSIAPIIPGLISNALVFLLLSRNYNTLFIKQ